MFGILLVFFIINSQNQSYYLSGYGESALGFKLEKETIEEVKKNIENYPKCDFFYIPLIKEKDEFAFKSFFLNSGTDPLVLLYLLKNYETYEEVLKKNRFDKIELLKRFLWAMQIEKKENCPENIILKKPKVLGFQDEISSDSYTLFLLYSFGDYQDSISFSTFKSIDKDYIKDELIKLMQRYKIPLVHRNIIEKIPQKIIKKKAQ